jgi:hypothetical protein
VSVWRNVVANKDRKRSEHKRKSRVGVLSEVTVVS